MFYLMMHSTHFIYDKYMASDMLKEHADSEKTSCRHMGYSFQLALRILLYASSHSLCYTSR